MIVRKNADCQHGVTSAVSYYVPWPTGVGSDCQLDVDMCKPFVYGLYTHVHGPWCLTFEFEGTDAYRVDFEQYH